MQVGDLVRIKGTGIVTLVTQIETVPNFYKSAPHPPTVWAFLSHDDRTPIKVSKLEVISASR